VLGLGREMIAAAAFGAGPIWSAFTVAFTIPNLFRKLFGEGAISAAFIPIYARLVRGDDPSAGIFARQSVNLLVAMLAVIVVIGEGVLLIAIGTGIGRDDYRLAAILTAIMLPYVVLICGAAFLGAILNVHERFIAPAAASVVLNLCLIAAIATGWGLSDLSSEAGRRSAVIGLAGAVVISGVLQVAMLWPSLRRSGFTPDLRAGMLSPATRRMLLLSLPIALSAGVLQISVLLDKGIAFFLSSRLSPTAVDPGSWLPMASGAVARLNWAQFMYQFPLGVFAIALATAIFPLLSREAAENAGRNDAFRRSLRKGVEAALFIGLPASAGLVLVSTDATRVLFERGEFTPADTRLVAASVAVYSAAVWAFSLQQIVNRAFYALQDMRTPLIWAGINLGLNLAVELPLIWVLPWPWGEVGMAAGTLVSFSVQATLMLWLLSRRVGGIGLRQSMVPVGQMLAATAVMVLVCLGMTLLPIWPTGNGTAASAIRLACIITVGGGLYLGLMRLLRPFAGA
jgi:putative peptidoglycan lipid II flippase